MVLIKNHNWNCYTYQFYKIYMDHHEAEVKLICFDKPSSPLKVHGLILSANSGWFELTLNGQYDQEVQMPYKKNVLRHLIHFIYKGAIDVERSIVPAILKAAHGLQVKGFDYNFLNFKSKVLEKPNLFTSSPDCSVISPAIDIPDVPRIVINPFALNKAVTLLKVNNDNDKTANGSDGKVLIIENEEQSPTKHQSTSFELSTPSIKNLQLNVTKDKLQNKRKIDESRSPEKTISNPKIRKKQLNAVKTERRSDRKIHKSRSSSKMDVKYFQIYMKP